MTIKEGRSVAKLSKVVKPPKPSKWRPFMSDARRHGYRLSVRPEERDERVVRGWTWVVKRDTTWIASGGFGEGLTIEQAMRDAERAADALRSAEKAAVRALDAEVQEVER